MNTALQNQRRRNREAARSRAQADKNYRHVGYLDALLHASSHCPYPVDTIAGQEWQGGYAEGQRALDQRFATERRLDAMREGCDL